MSEFASSRGAVVDWLDTVQTVVAALVLAAVGAVSIFRYGSRMGAWFSDLVAQNRRLFWAAMALAGWTVAVAAMAWGVALWLYAGYAGVSLDTPAPWTTASVIAILLASPAVAILAGIPWLILVGGVRVLRWRSSRSADREQGE
jgi:hypothetical protein